jgi:hypothetical protein
VKIEFKTSDNPYKDARWACVNPWNFHIAAAHLFLPDAT